MIKAALAVTLVFAVVVIVVSPFVDLPPTVQNTKIHVALVFLAASVLLAFQFRAQVAASPVLATIGRCSSDELDLLVVHRC